MTLPPGWRPRPPEAKPGVIPLRPLTVGELLGGVFATLRSHWRPLLAVSGSVAAVAVVLALPALIAAEPLVRAYFELVSIDPNASTELVNSTASELGQQFVAYLPWLLVAGVAQIMLMVVVDAGSALVVSRAVLGQAVTPGWVMSQVGRSLPRLLGLGLVMGLAVTIGLLLCLVPGLLLAAFWFAAPAALVLEQTSPIKALKRSGRMVSQSFWRVVGILLLVQIMLGFALQVLSIPLTTLASIAFLGGASGATPSTGEINLVLLSYLAFGVMALVAYPFVSVARALEYLDLRMRHEQLADALVDASRAQVTPPGGASPHRSS